jgi:hypothetical protein
MSKHQKGFDVKDRLLGDPHNMLHYARGAPGTIPAEVFQNAGSEFAAFAPVQKAKTFVWY